MSCAQAALDDYVEAAVVERLSRPDAADLLVPRVEVDMAGLAQEANGLRARLVNLGDLVESGDMTPGEYRQRKARLSEQLASHRGRDDRRCWYLAAGRDRRATRRRRDMGRLALDLARKKAVIDCLWTITVLPAARRGRGFDSEPGADRLASAPLTGSTDL